MSKTPNYFDENYDELVEAKKHKKQKISNIAKTSTATVEKKKTKKHHIKINDFFAIALLTIGTIVGTICKKIVAIIKRKPISRLLNNKKKWKINLVLSVVTILIFALMVGVVIYSVDHQNDKISKFDTDAGQVCSNFIKNYGSCSYENLYSTYGVQGYRMTGLAYVRELDFDGDGTSELLVSYDDGGMYYVEVWAYVDGEFSSIYHGTAAQTTDKADDAWITLYYHNGKYYIGAHDSSDISQVDLYAMKGDDFEKKSSCTYDTTSESFVVKDKVNYTDFERIKLSVLREEKANVVQNLVLDTIDDFSSDDSGTTETKTKSGISTAYYNIVKTYQQKYGVAQYKTNDLQAYIDGLASVKLVDFNGDGTNELMLIYRKSILTRDEDSSGNYIAKSEDKYFCDIYTYTGSVAKLVYQTEGLSQKQSNSIEIYTIIKNQGEKNYLCSNTFTSEQYGKVTTGTSSILGFDGTSFKAKTKSRYETSYGYTKYYINDKAVYRTEFLQDGYTVPFFDGVDSYDENTYTVIYLQKSVTNSDDLKTEIDQTNTIIDKLNKK